MIVGHGGYVPLYRIDREEIAAQQGGRGAGESAVPGRDENHVTMACEAAETALARAGVDGEALDAVYSASVTDPFAEHGLAAHVAYRLGATGDVRTGDLRSTARAATDALLAARTFVTATDGRALVVGVDSMPTAAGADDEPTAGAGAAALVLGPDEDPVATVETVGQETTGFVERHREHGEPAVGGDSRFERRFGVSPDCEAAIDRALADREGTPDRAALGVPDGRMARSALSSVETERVSTFDEVGFAGAASPLLDLVHLLETADPGEAALLVAYGAGGADALVLRTGPGVGRNAGATVEELLANKEYVNYATHLRYRERVEYEGT